MSTSTLLKWAAAAASGVLMIGAVPVMAAHVTHKHATLAAVTSTHVLKSTTPARSIKGKTLLSAKTGGKTATKTATKAKAKTLTSSHGKKVTKLSAKKTVKASALKHKPGSLDKTRKVTSNM
ncbi:MAG: hypothetical protein ABSH22_06305 [Tepidisphaeraceae bacterium]|jgi:hypothetical protein